MREGSKTMMFVPSRYRCAVTPRTPFEKSYSGRIVSRSPSVDLRLALSFFMVMALVSGSESGRDYPGSWRPLHESYYKKPARGGHAENQAPLFPDRVIRVRE